MRPKTLKLNCTLIEISITQSEVHDKLSSLNPHEAPGPDCLHPCLLKHCADSLAKPLYLLYTQSLNNGVIIPEEWKHTNITSLFCSVTKLLPVLHEFLAC